MDEIDEAIKTAKTAVSMTSPDNVHQASRISLLADCYYYRYRQIYSLEDLNESIRLSKELLATIPATHPNRASFLHNLTNYLQRLFRQTGKIESLQEALHIAEEAVSLTPHDHPEVGFRLRSLAACLHIKYEASGNDGDLLDAISRVKEALSITPRDNVYFCDILTSLALFLRDLSACTGRLDDLQESIEKAHETASATPKDYPGLGLRLTNLASLLMTRSERTGSLEDLQEAIDQAKKAAETLAPNHPFMGHIKSNLAAFYARLSHRNPLQRHLNDAIDWARGSVSATPSHHPDLALRLNNLSSCLLLRFGKTGNLDDWEEAVNHMEEALSTPNCREPFTFLYSLALCHYERFKKTLAIEDVNAYIQKTEKILPTIPISHPRRTMVANGLATGLYARFLMGPGAGTLSDNERAVALWQTMVESESTPPQDRIAAALRAVEGLRKMRNDENWNRICHIKKPAVRLLPQISSRALGQGDQQYMLRVASGLATLAASATLNGGRRTEHALELLDHGRGIIAELQLGSRTDLTALRERQPGLANEFEHLRNILNTPVPTPDFTTLSNDATRMLDSNERHKANLEFNSLVDKIRKETGFERFLLPPQAKDLKVAASSGPVVVINVNNMRCDAFLVKRSRIDVLHLRDLRHEDIDENVGIITSIRQQPARGDMETVHMYRMLGWLWEVLVGPVLNELGFTKDVSKDDEWPHVWWVPTGPLSMFPLHAAGLYISDSGKPVETALDRVVSSYSSSLKALLHARAASTLLRTRHCSFQWQALLAALTWLSPTRRRRVCAIFYKSPSQLCFWKSPRRIES